MNDKKQAFLRLIIEEYVKTAKPVGSKYIVEKCKLKVSPATVRNYMASLEEEGYITHPHTSAGRFPTEKGFNFYIENFLTDNEVDKEYILIIDKILKNKELGVEEKIKNTAKSVAEFTNQAIVLSLNPNSYYYTGISNILKKPDFADLDVIYSLSEVVDQLDEVMGSISKFVTNKVEIFVGKDNPFSENCSVILTPYSLDKDIKGVLGILGPIRMDYSKNYSLIKYLNNTINV
ncbi:MAG: hypothetical protein ABID45_04545 [Patescibacteria group bacterium]